MDVVLKFRKHANSIISKVKITVDNYSITGEVTSNEIIQDKYDNATYDGNPGNIIKDETDK